MKTIEKLKEDLLELWNISWNQKPELFDELNDALAELKRLRNLDEIRILTESVKLGTTQRELEEKVYTLLTELGDKRAKLKKAVEALKTVYSVDKAYADNHGHKNTINNMIGIARQALKDIEGDDENDEG